MGVSARLALATAVATCLVTPTAASAVTFRTSSAPAVIDGAPPWTVKYTLELDAGPVDEQVEVAASGNLEQITGPAKLVSHSVAMASIVVAPGCRIPPLLPWQTEFDFHGITLDLPAGTASFVTMSRTRTTFPAAMDNLAYTFHLFFWDPDGRPLGHVPVPLAGPAIRVPRRPELDVQSPDVPRFGALVEHKALRIRGKTDRRMAGQRLEFVYTTGTIWTGKRQLIGRVRVRRDGSFRYRWSVPRSGHYIVGARYRSQDRRFASTLSECGLGFGYAS